MKQVGNLKSNAMYNPDEKRHPVPANLIDSERDSELEKFIRSECLATCVHESVIYVL